MPRWLVTTTTRGRLTAYGARTGTRGAAAETSIPAAEALGHAVASPSDPCGWRLAGVEAGYFPVSAVFGADRPPGHQQRLTVGAGDGERVDDPQIDPGHPAGIGFLTGRVGGDGEFGGHVQVQPAVDEQQCHCPDRLGWVGHRPVETDKQRRTSPGRRKPYRAAGQGEGAVVPADRHQRASPPRITHLERPGLTSGSSRKPGVGVPAQHRPGTRAVQLAEHAGSGLGQQAAQFLIPAAGRSPRRRRHPLISSTQAQRSPAERSRPKQRCRWAWVSRSPIRAVRCTTRLVATSRRLGIQTICTRR
jgi:hypothetical protein